MTSSELGEAIAYDNIDPCGEYRAELRHGEQMHMLYMANFKPDDDNPLRPVDFMNFIDRPEEPEMTDEELEAFADQVFR